VARCVAAAQVRYDCASRATPLKRRSVRRLNSRCKVDLLKNRPKPWAQVKSLLKSRNDVALLGLLRDLYELSEENRHFIQAKLTCDTSTLRPYLEAVEKALYPDVYRNQPVRLGEARRAIAEYKKATKDGDGTLELMLRFVECGTEFTAEFGDIDERFYSSLSSMFARVVDAVGLLPAATQRPRVERLCQVVERARAVGWGYHDEIADLFYSAFPHVGEVGVLPDA
jgi:hypothetical protein